MNKFIFNENGFRIKNYTGIKNNYLTAVSYSHSEKRKTFWLFKCKCGNQKILTSNKVFAKNTSTKGCGCSIGKTSENPAFYSVYSRYIKGANIRSLNFELSENDFKTITSQNCHYCGIEPKKISKSKFSIFTYNGIDRKINNKGYTIDNCLPCCTLCNKAKRDLDYNIFVEWINQISKFYN